MLQPLSLRQLGLGREPALLRVSRGGGHSLVEATGQGYGETVGGLCCHPPAAPQPRSVRGAPTAGTEGIGQVLLCIPPINPLLSQSVGERGACPPALLQRAAWKTPRGSPNAC